MSVQHNCKLKKKYNCLITLVLDMYFKSRSRLGSDCEMEKKQRQAPRKNRKHRNTGKIMSKTPAPHHSFEMVVPAPVGNGTRPRRHRCDWTMHATIRLASRSKSKYRLNPFGHLLWFVYVMLSSFLAVTRAQDPTSQPTQQPSQQPTREPSGQPTEQPTQQPTRQPTMQPSRQPISHPTSQPSRQPSSQPTRQPVMHPTSQPSGQPSYQPTAQPGT